MNNNARDEMHRFYSRLMYDAKGNPYRVPQYSMQRNNFSTFGHPERLQRLSYDTVAGLLGMDEVPGVRFAKEYARDE